MRMLSIVAILFSAGLAFAGGVDGGGGKALVCRNSLGIITRAEVLDLYEGSIMYGTTFIESSDPFELQMKAAFARLDSGKALTYNYLAEKILKNMRIMPHDTKLLPVDDSLEIIAPKTCTFEQAANFYNPQLILIDGEIWNAFSPTQKAALIAHEAIYWDARESGSKNSRRSRYIVAHAFDPNFKAEEVLDGVPKDAPLCYATTDDSSQDPQTEFFYFPSPNHPTEMVLQFTKIAGRPIVTKTTTFLSADFNFHRTYDEQPGDSHIGSKMVANNSTLSILDTDRLMISQEIEPVIDQYTRQTVPGVHYESYYIWGYSETEPNTQYARMTVGCYFTIPIPTPTNK